MAKVTFYRLLDKSGVPERTNNEIITAANLKPGYGILSSDQSYELVDQEGNIVKRSNDEGSSAKRSGPNFNGCGQDITEEYLKSK